MKSIINEIKEDFNDTVDHESENRILRDEIKLVICDMDGTLLHDYDKKVSDDLPYVVEELHKRGVRFVCASGRQKASVEDKIKTVKTPVTCFGDNAGVLYLDGEMVSVHEIDREVLFNALDVVRGEPDIYLTVTMADGWSYYEDEVESVHADMEEFYVNYRFIKDLKDAKGQIIKLSFLDYKDPTGRGMELLRDVGKGYNLMPTGGPWIDIVRKEVSKGYGLQVLVDKLGLTLDNVAAFGDGENDISMLKIAKYSFAMANGTENVKKTCRYSCDSADNDGVTKKLKEIFEIV